MVEICEEPLCVEPLPPQPLANHTRGPAQRDRDAECGHIAHGPAHATTPAGSSASAAGVRGF